MTGSSARGFALTEVLFAALILAVAMGALLALFPAGAKRTAFGDAQLRAHLRAEALLSDAVGQANRDGFAALSPVKQLDGARIGFEPVAGYPGLWTVTVRVDWEAPAEMGGGRRSYALSRLLHRTEQGLVGDWPLANGGRR